MQETLGATIKRARLEKNLSYRKLRDASGIAINTIRRLEDGTGTPYARTLFVLADHLELDVDVLLNMLDAEMRQEAASA